MKKLDLAAVRQYVKDDLERYRVMVPHLQTMIFTMVGGGHLGSFAAEQPARFLHRRPSGAAALCPA